jgi:hypothetical protein
MSNTRKLEEMVHTYLLQLIQNKSEDFTPELELRFTGCVDGEYTNRPQPISNQHFYDVIQVFKSLNPAITSFAMTSGEYLLRIYPYHNGKSSPFRCEITGLEDIQRYCVTNDWKTCVSARFVRKEKVYDDGRPIEDIFMDSYAIKASYKREVSYIGHQIEQDPQLKEIANNWSKVEKTFRHMNRFSFTIGENGFVKVDASIVKSSNQDDRGNFIPVRDIHQSNVFKNFEKYEIELEVNNENILSNVPTKGNSTQYAIHITKEIQKAIHKVLVGLQKSPFPIPKDEMVTALEEYIRTINYLDDDANIERFVGRQGLTSPRNFIGPSSVTLQFENLYENEITGTKAPCIKHNYTVTDKADGERCLMFISPKTKRIYLIDMNMFVRYTGVELKLRNSPGGQDGLFETIIDGEYITKDKNNNPISLFMAFDIYFMKAGTKNESSLRSRPFLNYETKNGTFGFGRYETLKETMNMLNNVIDKYYTLSKNACEFRLKNFKIIFDTEAIKQEYVTNKEGIVVSSKMVKLDEMSSLNQACMEVLSMDYIYNIDGLIFTPSNLCIGGTYETPTTPGPLTKFRWEYSFKWKPPQYNTNDFLITTLKTETNEDRVTNLIEPYTNPSGAVQMVQYKTLELRCGFSYKKSGYIDAFTKILSMQKMEQIREEYKDVNNYQPILFYPTDYPDRYAHTSHIILEPDDSGNKQMFTEEGDIIEDNTIVEFRYEHNNESGFKWVPLRVRKDKTHEYRKGMRSYGNDYETANGNWKSIMNPITEEMITTPDRLPPYEEVKISNDAYYTKSSAGDRDILQKFHNYVKEALILSSVQKDQTIIDVACGKAGDLWKWDKAKASFVFGIDYSRDNIENRFDGAAARYMNYYKDRLNNPSRGSPTETIRCIFATGDSSKNIRNGDALLNEINKNVSDAVLGIGGGVRESVIGNLYGIGSNGFDVCSCQFALHYFFRNVSTLEGFMTNVCQNVKMGGLFIGTCYNGKAVFDVLKRSGKGMVTVYSQLEEYWRCLQKYNQTEFEDDSSSLGYEIDIYQKSIGIIHTEYLVNFDYLERVMENYGFTPVKITPFKTIYDELDGPTYEKYRELSTMPENIITFLNCTFVYQKIRDVDPLLVALDRTPIVEKEVEKVEREAEKKEEKEAEKKEEKEEEKKEEKEAEEPIVQPPPPPPPKPTAVPAEPEKKKKTRKCKDTEELVEDRCLKKCEENEYRNPTTKRCNKTKKNK